MADTSYTDGVTLITADTMNDLNRLHYTIFADPATLEAARSTFGIYKMAAMSIQGLTYARAADVNNDTTIAAGMARDATNARDIVLSSAITKQIDAAWAVGNDLGGLDTGVKAANTWYALWLILRSGTGVVDALYSTSFTSPTMPTNYDYKRLIGAVKTDGSSNILAYATIETAGGGLDYLWADPPLDVDVTEDTTADTRTLGGVPAFAKLYANLNVFVSTSGATDAAAYVSSLDANDEAASLTAAPLASILDVSDGTTTSRQATYMRVRTNASGQIRTVAIAATTTLRISTLGWDWSRR